MHMIKRIPCRLVQLAFRAALPVLPYREPKLLDDVEDIAPLLLRKGVVSVLLVTDRAVRGAGLTAALERALASVHIACAVYEDVVPNPTIDNVEEGRRRYAEANAQAVIAVGGGSAIDCAKVIGARVAKPRQSVQRMKGLLRVMRRTPMMIAVPTTAGTGSETTLAAVITDAEKKHKYPINDFSLIPDYAVLDARLTLGLPQHLTATTGMDALTHAVEAYIGRSTTAHTRAMAEEAVRLIAENLLTAYREGENMGARRNMLRAAYCAGIAFTQSYVGYVHGVAHSLGGQYGVPHGLANAVILPHFLEAYGTSCHRKLAQLARRAGITGAAEDDVAAKAFILWVREMNGAMNIPDRIPQIRFVDIPVMAENAARECNPLYPVPRLMDKDELAGMYLKLMPEEEKHEQYCCGSRAPAGVF